MEILAGIENRIIAFICYNNTANIAHSGRGCRLGQGWGLDVSIPDLELLQVGGEGDVETPGGGGTRQPGLAQVKFPNISLPDRAGPMLTKYSLS